MVVFETSRLLVRPWTQGESDLDRLFDIYSRDEVARWLGSVPRTLTSRDEASMVVDRWAARTDPAGKRGIWAVQRREDGQVVGTVLLVALTRSEGAPEGAPERAHTGSDEPHSEVEVGWHLHPDAWGNGYATEAARGAIDHGFADGLSEIYAVVRPDNEASLAVCRRLGMTPLGRTQRWYGVELEAFRIQPNENGPHGSP